MKISDYTNPIYAKQTHVEIFELSSVHNYSFWIH